MKSTKKSLNLRAFTRPPEGGGLLVAHLLPAEKRQYNELQQFLHAHRMHKAPSMRSQQAVHDYLHFFSFR